MGVLDRLERLSATWHLRHRPDRGTADRSGGAERSATGTSHFAARSMADGARSAIDHVVILMMENHSFDNYLGTLGIGDGLRMGPDGEWLDANDKLKGGVVRPFPLSSTTQQPHVPTQSWRASHIQYADGTNQGFVRSIETTVPDGDPTVAMGHWTEKDLPFYASLARNFGVADRWHCSLLGPTFPNRRFLIAGTANGLIDDVIEGMFDRPRSGTIFDLLDRKGVAWVNYHHVQGWPILAKRLLGSLGLRGARRARATVGRVAPRLLTVGADNLQFTADLYPAGLLRCLRHLRHIDRFFGDARAGRLPQVSIVDPDFQRWSEENPQDIQLGEGFAAAVINAVIQSPAWPRTVLVWLYDEHGGYFDHVVPGPATVPDTVKPRSFLQVAPPVRWLLQRVGLWKQLGDIDTDTDHEAYDCYGFRVPAVVVSPFTPAGVSSTVYDHTSILRMIGTLWDLPPLTDRVRDANDPLADENLFDFTPGHERPPVNLAPPARPWNPARR